MYKVLVLKEVAIGGWSYDNETNSKFADGYLVLSHELTIPFTPYPGIQFSDGKWFSDPLQSVRYDVERQKFICHVSEDSEIPDNLDLFAEKENKSETEIDKYIEGEIKFKKQMYLDWGWEIYNSKVIKSQFKVN